jgi:hypothetical protein
VAHGRPRLKCTCLLCPLWGRGLAEWKIQAQVIAALRGAADQMATIAAAPVAAEVSPADQAKRQQVAQLEALAAQGVQGLEPTIEALRLELEETSKDSAVATEIANAGKGGAQGAKKTYGPSF